YATRHHPLNRHQPNSALLPPAQEPPRPHRATDHSRPVPHRSTPAGKDLSRDRQVRLREVPHTTRYRPQRNTSRTHPPPQTVSKPVSSKTNLPFSFVSRRGFSTRDHRLSNMFES